MEEPDPNDEAFCPVLWQANGGKLRKDGSPIYTNEFIVGNCREPGDCDTCNLMQGVLANLASQGVTCLWICPACAGHVHDSAKTHGIEMKMPGFYTEGLCQRPQCHRGEVGNEARYSSLLQLITVFGTQIP